MLNSRREKAPFPAWNVLGHATALLSVAYLATAISGCEATPDNRTLRLLQATALIEACEQSGSADDATNTGEADTGQRARIWLIDDQTACYDGPVTEDASTWFQDRDTPLTTLVIRSGGGNGQAGVIIGEALARWETGIVVRDYCLSACASSIFVGAVQRTVPEPGILGWHHGLPWTRYEALWTGPAAADENLRAISGFAIRRFNRLGRNDVPHTVWLSLPDPVREQLEAHPDWRLRIERLYNHAGVLAEFRSAYVVAWGRAPEHVAEALPALRQGVPMFWTPDEETLRHWGFSDTIMWDTTPEAVLELGLQSSLRTVNVRAPVRRGDFPIYPDPAWPDDSDEWPVYGEARQSGQSHPARG